jgi:Zn-dependent protease
LGRRLLMRTPHEKMRKKYTAYKGATTMLNYLSSIPLAFLSAIGFLALLQMIALFINLLPIPGLDGFGILEHFLPREWVEFSSFLRPFGFIIVFFFLSTTSPLSDFFWGNVWSAMELFGPELAYYANEGVLMLFP